MNMDQIRVLFNSKDKDGTITRTNESRSAYDNAMRDTQIEDIDDDNTMAVLTSIGMEDVITTLFYQIEQLNQRVAFLEQGAKK